MKDRNEYPMFDGLLAYFPAALAEVARCSKVGNDQHNPGEPLHWARGKSTDHANKIIRHLMEAGTMDTDGVPHSAKVAWRALALLQEECEKRGGIRSINASFPLPARITSRTWTAEEIALLDGAPIGGGHATHYVEPPETPELPPAIAALAEAQMADDPHVGSLKAGEVGRDEEE